MRSFLRRPLPFVGWRQFWLRSLVAFIFIAIIQGYRLWRGGDVLDFWTRIGFMALTLLVFAGIWAGEPRRQPFHNPEEQRTLPTTSPGGVEDNS